MLEHLWGVREAEMFQALGMAVALAITPAIASAQPVGGVVEGSTDFQSQATPAPQMTEEETRVLFAKMLLFGPDFLHVEINGWTFAGRGEDALAFTQPARQARHIWTRWELKVPNNGIRSWRSLYEFDCTGWRLRDVQLNNFSEANLEGLLDSSDRPTAWSSPPPGTLAEKVLETACDQ